MKKAMLMMAAVGAAAGMASGQLTLELLTSVDVSGEFNGTTGNGSNVASVAWNGSTLWLGGFNNLGSDESVGVVRFDDVLGTISGPASFGQTTVSGFTGYEYADTDGTSVFLSNTGVANSNGVAGLGDVVGFDGSNAEIPGFVSPTGGSASTSPVEGLVFDPRFGGLVRSKRFGSGFQVVDGADGSDASDIIVFSGAVGTGYRGIDIDSSANLYVRAENGAFLIPVTGGDINNGTFDAAGVVTLATAAGDDLDTGQIGVDIAALETSFGSFALFNDGAPDGDESFEAAFLATDLLGNSIDVSFETGGVDLGDSSTFFFSLDYDAATETVAISDLSNNVVHVFQVTPTPGSAVALGAAGLIAARRRRG